MECHILEPIHEHYELISERIITREHVDTRTFVFIPQHYPRLRGHLDYICHTCNEEGVVQH